MKSVNLLGVRIDDLSMSESLEMVEGWISKGGSHKIYTPNPEFLVKAYEDPSFKKILNASDLNIPDGRGLRLSGVVKNTTTGVDLMEALCKLSAEKGFTVGLLGGWEGVAEKTSECLKNKYKNLKITYINENVILERSDRIPPADILFVALGMGKQERWIEENIGNYKIHVMMGVGGSFDYISGRVQRAPKIIRSLGFEWLFRLILQPWRLKRQLKLLKYLYLLITRKT
jgi:N-acetylglucosaminyldiphosphoundecaprenol N-acetyl-beta-D-mannosaminyltransferase